MSSNVSLIGNITRDPELRFTPNGQAIATFGLAVSRRWQNRQTQAWEESTSFFDVVCWGSLAENVSESLPKGARVLVTGRLDQRSWETQDGEKRSKIEVVADEVGPSLRWALAKPEKIERRNGQPAGPSGGGSSGGSYGGQSRSSGGQTQPVSPAVSQPEQQGSSDGEPRMAPTSAGYEHSEEEPF
jgi:single-strand DNA-binding protein